MKEAQRGWTEWEWGLDRAGGELGPSGRGAN